MAGIEEGLSRLLSRLFYKDPGLNTQGFLSLFYNLIRFDAGFVKWYYLCLPSRSRGFDSLTPLHSEVAEWPNARDCKSLKPSVRIRPSLPYSSALSEARRADDLSVFEYGSIVYRLVHRPVTADGGVRFPLGPPTLL